MKRFLPITPQLSLIREKHRVLVQYLHLVQGDTLVCSAALSKKDLREQRALRESGRATFENELGQISWESHEGELNMRFLEGDRILAQLRLTTEEQTRFEEALADLAPRS